MLNWAVGSAVRFGSIPDHSIHEPPLSQFSFVLPKARPTVLCSRSRKATRSSLPHLRPSALRILPLDSITSTTTLPFKHRHPPPRMPPREDPHSHHDGRELQTPEKDLMRAEVPVQPVRRFRQPEGRAQVDEERGRKEGGGEVAARVGGGRGGEEEVAGAADEEGEEEEEEEEVEALELR